jgi:hypothetical protein
MTEYTMEQAKQLIMANRKPIYFVGPAHGWLKVWIGSIPEHIREAISSYSYRSGQYAYLEEDCDMGLFLKHVHGGYSTEHIDDEEFIRSLPSWKWSSLREHYWRKESEGL